MRRAGGGCCSEVKLSGLKKTMIDTPAASHLALLSSCGVLLQQRELSGPRYTKIATPETGSHPCADLNSIERLEHFPWVAHQAIRFHTNA